MTHGGPEVARAVDGGQAAALPTVVATSVIRSAHQGESHGGVFLIDLAAGRHDQVIDWNDGSIDWSGRGGDRGLRGIAFHDGRVFLAASDEIFVYDTAFRPITSLRSRYLRHCHEIAVDGDDLYLTSTGFDSILVFDLGRWRFSDGLCVRDPRLSTMQVKMSGVLKRLRSRRGRLWRAMPAVHPTRLAVHRFDPEKPGGPEPADIFHINSVDVGRAGLFLCGTRLAGLFRLAGDRAERVASVPPGTHNTRLLGDTLVYNDTGAGRVVAIDPDGAADFRLPLYRAEALQYGNLGRDHARMAFGRGLCSLGGDLIAAGSSPATVSVFRWGSPAAIASVNLTMDVRNAIHGLEVWPFDRRLDDWRSRLRRSSTEPPRRVVDSLTMP